MKKILKASNGDLTDSFLNYSLSKLNLMGKDVLVYSSLINIGKPYNKESIEIIIKELKNSIGPFGTLIIPTYTLNSFQNPYIFDIKNSQIMSGALAQIAVKDRDFTRTVHPIYSNSVYGFNKELYSNQSLSTCFGEDSFFDIFSKNKNSVVLMLGLNFNGCTIYHYFDQKYNSKGRFIKKFKVKMKLEDHVFSLSFDSYVKNHEFYKNKTNCLARFDSALTFLKLYDKISFGDSYISKIKTSDFEKYYRAALEIDQEYFLMGLKDEWKEYYLRNNNSSFEKNLNQDLLKKLKSKISKWI